MTLNLIADVLLLPTPADLEAVFAIISQLKGVREARAAAWAVVREVPGVLPLAMQLLPAVATGALTRPLAAARVIASGLVLPVIAAAARAYPGTAGVVNQLKPLLRKAGFADDDIAGACVVAGHTAASSPPTPPAHTPLFL